MTASESLEETPSLRWATVVVALIGLLATILTSVALARQEATRQELAIQARVSEAAERVDSAARRAFDAAFAVRALVGGDPDLSRGDFRRAIREGGLLEAFPRVSAISFARWVPADEVAAFSAELERRTGTSPGIRPEPEPGQGAVVVDWIEPLEGNEAAVGFALTGEDRRREAVLRARDNGVPTASAPIELVQDPGAGPAVLLLVPIYAGGQSHATGPERRRSFLGVASMVIRARVLLSDALPAGATIDLQINDVGSVDEDGPGAGAPLLTVGEPDPERLSATIDTSVGDRRWRLIATANDAFAPGAALWQVTLLFGLVLTGLLVALVRTQRSARQRAESLVRARTSELQAANERLVEADLAKSTFLGTVSHELRTPLAAITGFLGMLRKPDIADRIELRDELLTRMDRNAKGLHSLIEEVLEFSRLESGPDGLALATLDLSEVVGETLDSLEPIFGEHRVVREFRPGVEATANAGAVHRIVANLVTNAVKHGGPDARIRVEVTRTSGPAGDVATILVHDDGPGIDPEDLDKVFDRFHRGARTVGISGTGIGLTVVRELAQRMGGEATVTSSPDSGTTASVALPLVDANVTRA